MVNRGRSAGCSTCKQRRVKCDEAKPKCRTCQRLGVRCEGYRKPRYASIRFKDESHKFVVHDVHQSAGRDIALAGSSPAVRFYLNHYAGMGRDMGSTRGFFEMLIPVYLSQPRDSALSLAVSVLATEVYSMWQQEPSSFRAARQSYTVAIQRLHAATQSPLERGVPATVLAALVLQTYENACAIYGLRWASSVHHNGAASLLFLVRSDDIEATVRTYLRKFIVHTEVSTALRQQKPMDKAAISLIGSVKTNVAHDNPSSVLDIIGASLASLQSSFACDKAQRSVTILPENVLRHWRNEAKRIEAELLAWGKNVPDHWIPVRLTGGRDFDQSIPSFQSTCQIYPSCQIASIWNFWRCQRLLLAKVTLTLLNLPTTPDPADGTKSTISGDLAECQRCEATTLEMIDSICYSIPFYLGSRISRCSLEDFEDPSVLLPSDSASASNPRLKMGGPSQERSYDAHRRHIIAQGPWRAMHPLGRLVTLFSEDESDTLAKMIRPGQFEWIRDQLLRVAILLHLPHSPQDLSQQQYSSSASADVRARSLASEMRKGAILMSGP